MVRLVYLKFKGGQASSKLIREKQSYGMWQEVLGLSAIMLIFLPAT